MPREQSSKLLKKLILFCYKGLDKSKFSPFQAVLGLSAQKIIMSKGAFAPASPFFAANIDSGSMLQ
jgi:hypothetical protein